MNILITVICTIVVWEIAKWAWAVIVDILFCLGGIDIFHEEEK